tara:strand:+ start:2065 stop:2565 length:501 start_codon:yes stop_codon:yes gene_type:complete
MNKIPTPLPNGRIDIMDSAMSSHPFFVERDNNYTFNKHAVTAIYEFNKLQEKYFSNKNINLLQHKIKKRVYKQSKNNYDIANQDIKILKIIMKSIYLQYGKNLDKDIVNQVKTLNRLVLNYSVNNIISNIELYMTYKKSVSYNPVPLELPKYISTSGLKTKKNFID